MENSLQSKRAARRYTVRGHVQGVGFRYFVQRTATKLGVAGWVRNRPDGSVEAQGEGTPELLAAFRAALEKGPPVSRVDSVHEAPATVRDEGAFRIVGDGR